LTNASPNDTIAINASARDRNIIGPWISVPLG